MLIDDHKRFVELTIDSIMCGKVRFDISSFETDESSKEIRDIYEKLGVWIRLRNNQDSNEFKTITEQLWVEFIGARASHQLIGELREDDLGVINTTLKENLKDANREINQLKSDKEKLHNENIALANELEDQKNIINSYENSSIRKK